MTAQLYDQGAKKKSCNASINSDLITKAKEHGINISQTLEKALSHQLKERVEANWVSENKQAIEDYNKRVIENGTLAEQEGLL